MRKQALWRRCCGVGDAAELRQRVAYTATWRFAPDIDPRDIACIASVGAP